MKTFAPELTEHDSLDGLPVFDCEGTRVGQVEESFVDARSSQTVFAVVRMLPESELGDERFVVPARQFRVVHEGGRRFIRLQAGLPALMAAPHWSELRWIDTVNARWADCVDRQDGGTPNSAAARTSRDRYDATVGQEALVRPRRQSSPHWESGTTPNFPS